MVSILMGVKAGTPRMPEVKRAIDSILSQTETNLELLICDAGSSPELSAWLKRWAEQDSRIKLVEAPPHSILTKKLNLCFRASRGEWIARMDDDDYSYPTRIQKQIEFLERNPAYAVVGCNVRETGSNADTVRKLPPFPELKDFRITFPFVHPALVFRREAFTCVGGYSESRWQDHCDDYDLLLRIYEQGGRGANIQEVLLDYSVKNSQERPRPYRYFVNEFVTRLMGFYRLGKLPAWGIYAVKPLIVGLLPRRAVKALRDLKRHGLGKACS